MRGVVRLAVSAITLDPDGVNDGEKIPDTALVQHAHVVLHGKQGERDGQSAPARKMGQPWENNSAILLVVSKVEPAQGPGCH